MPETVVPDSPLGWEGWNLLHMPSFQRRLESPEHAVFPAQAGISSASA
ncbi:MAG TPA: hypothetical protein PL188_02100 [Candidatus Cloacimonadota bacterium]|nr:hypothetical protein [Candidatus Cloacimonadota bacterium]